MTAHILSGILTLMACFVLMCRIDKMIHGVTRPTVFAQHAGLCMGMFVSVILNFTEYENWSQAAMALGLLWFFFFSIGRWKRGAPDGTTKPGVLDPVQWNHIGGGRK